MNKVLLVFSILLSISAIVVGVIALCLICPRVDSLGFDYQGVIVGILSLLVTILLGWNIFTFLDLRKDCMNYKMESDKKLSVLDSLENKINDDRYRSTFALHANVDLMQGEIYLIEKYYLIAYREYASSIVRFNSSGDTDLHEQIICKMGLCIRNIDSEIRNNGYVLDWDFSEDIFHYSNVAKIEESKKDYLNLDITLFERIIKSLILKSDYIKVLNFKFTLYRKNIEIKERGGAIYALFAKYNNTYKHKGRVYAKYELLMNDIMQNLNLCYDYIGVCERYIGNIEDVVKKISDIDDCKYIKYIETENRT